MKATAGPATRRLQAFKHRNKYVVETIDMVERAVGIIVREMSGDASMMQLQKGGSVVEALSAMVKSPVLV